MARYAVVAPPVILEGLLQDRRLPSAHLLLAHDVATNYDRYHRIFTDPIWEEGFHGSSRIVILDNSVIETGNAVDIRTIARAVDAVTPTVVVLPDVLLDCPMTIVNCSKALDSQHWDDLKTQYMIVPQGKTLREFIYCAEVFAEDPRITWWGVPRNLVAQPYLGTRSEAIKLLHIINPTRRIHMMGFSDDSLDDVMCARNPLVTSIDSAVPLRYPDTFHLTATIGARGDWWDTAKYSPRVLENLAIAQRLFEGK